MKNILYSFLGTTLDQRQGGGRWNYWRPSVALAMQEDLRFDEYHIWYQSRFERLFQAVASDIRLCSPETEVIPEVMELENPWDFEEVYGKLYDFSRGCRFQPEENVYYIHITTGTHVAQICLFLLNESHHLPGKLIQTQPSRDQNPARGRYSVIDLDLSRYDLLAKRFAVERQSDQEFLKSGIATRNAAFNSLIATIERVAIRSREPILLTGPTGAGKSRLAQKIYELKRLNHQVSGRFVDVNCATLRGDTAMSALFGHTRGAFTGADKVRPGLLKAADGGVLFLDEIGELGLDEQAMLLRAIEEKRFLPLGADEESESSFQLICGTNRDLAAAVQAGKFRDDLYQRINLWRFHLPGLAERREDIEPNLAYELDRYAKRTGKHISFNSEARRKFLDFAHDGSNPWAGNFRDLNAMVVRMATLADGGRITAELVDEEIARHGEHAAGGETAGQEEDASLDALLGKGWKRKIDDFEAVQLVHVIKVCRESESAADAARKLFAVSMKAKSSANHSDRLVKYLARYGLKFKEIR